MKLSITSNSEKNFTHYQKTVTLDIDSMTPEELTTFFSTYKNSPVEFLGNRRKNFNFISANVICADFETKPAKPSVDGLPAKKAVTMATIKEVMSTNLYKHNRCIIVTSKSHQVEGNGDCFHLYVITDGVINSLIQFKHAYSEMIKELEEDNALCDQYYKPTGYFNQVPATCEIYQSYGELYAYAPYIETPVELSEVSPQAIAFNAACLPHIELINTKISLLLQDMNYVQMPPDSLIRQTRKFNLGHAVMNKAEWVASLNAIKSLFGDTAEGQGMAKLLSSGYVRKEDNLNDSAEQILNEYKSCNGDSSIYRIFEVYNNLMCRAGSWRMTMKSKCMLREISEVTGMLNFDSTKYISEGYQIAGKRGRTMKSTTAEPKKISEVRKDISNNEHIYESQAMFVVRGNVEHVDVDAAVGRIINAVIEEVVYTIKNDGKIKCSSIADIRKSVINSMGYATGLLDRYVTIKEIKTIIEDMGYKIHKTKICRYYIAGSTAPVIPSDTQPIKEEITQAPEASVDEREGMYIGELDITSKTFINWDADYDFGMTYRRMDRYNDEEGRREQLFPPKVTQYVYDIDMTRFTTIENLIKNIETANNLGFIDSRKIVEEDMYGTKQYIVTMAY